MISAMPLDKNKVIEQTYWREAILYYVFSANLIPTDTITQKIKWKMCFIHLRDPDSLIFFRIWSKKKSIAYLPQINFTPEQRDMKL